MPQIFTLIKVVFNIEFEELQMINDQVNELITSSALG